MQKKERLELYMCDYVMRDDIARHYYTTTITTTSITSTSTTTFGVNYCYEYDEGGGSSRRRRRRFAATSFIFVGEEGVLNSSLVVERCEAKEFGRHRCQDAGRQKFPGSLTRRLSTLS